MKKVLFSIDFLVEKEKERQFLEAVENLIEYGFAIKSEVTLREDD